MGLQIKRVGSGGDRTGPSLWTLLTSKAFAQRWVGRAAPQLPQLPLPTNRNTLLYFRTRGCTACDLIDMRVAAACKQGGVELLMVDRYPKSDDPAELEIYTQPENILDRGGPINAAYQIGVYPSFVLVDSRGRIVLKEVGGPATPPEQFGNYLRDRFHSLLPS